MNEYESRDRQLLAGEKDAFALLAAGQGLSAALDLLLTRAEQILAPEPTLSIWVVKGDCLGFCAGPNVPKAYRDAADGRPLGSEDGPGGRAVRTKRPIAVSDLGASDLRTTSSALLTAAGIRAVCSTPLFSSLDEVLGTFDAFFSAPRLFQGHDLALLARIARTAALLIERDRADEALRHSREQLQLLTDTVPVLISYVDTDRRYRFCNRRYVEWFGLPAEHLIGQPMRAVLGEQAWKTIGPRIDEAFAGRVVEYEAETAYSRGGTRWIHCVYTPHRDAQGAVCGVVVHVRDITAMKREQLAAETALSESEQLLREATDAAQVVAWDIDLRTGIVQCKGTTLAIWGMAEGPLQRFLERIHPEDRALVESQMDHSIRTSRTLVLEYRIIDPRGEGKWLYSRGDVLSDPEGRPIRFTGVTVDITERKRAEEEARRLATIIDATPDFVAIAGLDGRLLYLNQAGRRMVGISAEADIASACHAEFWPPWVDERMQTEWLPAALRDGFVTGEIALLTATGEETPVSFVLLVHRNAAGQPEFISTIARDITDRKRAEEVIAGNENLLRRIFDAATVGMCLLDADLRFVAANRQFAAICRSTPERLIGMDARTFLDRGDQAKAAAVIAQRLEGDDAPRVNLWNVVTAEGTRRLVQGNSIRIVDRSGQSLVLKVIQDITEQAQAERAAQESRERYVNLVNSIEGIVWEVDLATKRFTFVSPQAERILGYRLDHWYEMSFWEAHLHPDDRRRVVEFCESETRAGRDHAIEYRMLAADGRTVWIRDIVTVVMEGAQPRFLRGLLLDITTSKEAEQDIATLNAHVRQGLEELQTLMNVLPVGIFVARDRNCSTIFANPAGAAMLGLPEATNVSKNGPASHALPFRVMRDGAEVPPEDLPMQRAARTGKPVVGEETGILFADGTTRNFYEYAVPLFDDSNRVRGCVGVFVDITGQKHAERALRLSEERFRLATAAGKVGVWEWDIRSETVTWTDSLYRIHGITHGDIRMTAEGFGSLVHQDDRSKVFDALDAALTRDVPYEVEFRALRPDGSTVWLFTNAVVLREEGRPVRMIGATVDISLAKRAAEQLREWNAELEQRVGARTRELEESQERLRALATELNLAEQRERKRVAAELHDHLAQLLVLSRLKIGQAKRASGIPDACTALLHQTEDVLSDALAYTRTLVADLSPPVLHEFGLVAALKWLGEYMRRYDLAVQLEIGCREEMVRLPENEAMLLFQSVRELLMNAHKHAHAQEAVITITADRHRLQIRVFDRGPGFNPESAAGAQERAAPRVQFGLFSIRERMRALGGIFDIESTPGEGTTATLTLPLATRDVRDTRESSRDPESARKRLSPPSPIAAGSQQAVIRVLLVDDHAMVRQGLRSVLETYADVQVAGEAANGEDAVELVNRLLPSVVVMDINMPRMNGIEATARIKARHPGVSVIGLSVNAAGDNQDAMRAAGAAMLLTKEAAVEQLYESILRAIGGPAPNSGSG